MCAVECVFGDNESLEVEEGYAMQWTRPGSEYLGIFHSPFPGDICNRK